MVLKENSRYKKHEIFSNRKENPKKEATVMHRLYDIKGKYDFEGLDLREYGWKQVHPCSSKERTEAEETLVYAGPQGIAVMCLNYETDYHQIEIILKNHHLNDTQTVDNIKSMFETNLEGKLNDISESNKTK
jgi:hypothetical protein